MTESNWWDGPADGVYQAACGICGDIATGTIEELRAWGDDHKRQFHPEQQKVVFDDLSVRRLP